LGGAGTDIKKCSTVKLAKPLIECFATLSSKCKDEEVEDLVYFVLDIYQFHGIPVALAELDIDQVSDWGVGVLSLRQFVDVSRVP
jgi:separase